MSWLYFQWILHLIWLIEYEFSWNSVHFWVIPNFRPVVYMLSFQIYTIELVLILDPSLWYTTIKTISTVYKQKNANDSRREDIWQEGPLVVDSLPL